MGVLLSTERYRDENASIGLGQRALVADHKSTITMRHGMMLRVTHQISTDTLIHYGHQLNGSISSDQPLCPDKVYWALFDGDFP